MGIVCTSQEVVHPEGKILLQNGNVIDGFPRENATEPVARNHGLQIDTTGVFLQVGKPRKKQSRNEFPHAQECELLKRYAFNFYRMRDRIYSDSRMFLTPLDTGCNIAYTGRSGLGGATLGVWLEWWDSLEQCRKDDKGRDWLVFFFAGSPLSGINHSHAVYPDGKDKRFSFSSFLPVWSTFMQINSRYEEPKQKYESYTLNQTLEKLGLTSFNPAH